MPYSSTYPFFQRKRTRSVVESQLPAQLAAAAMGNRVPVPRVGVITPGSFRAPPQDDNEPMFNQAGLAAATAANRADAGAFGGGPVVDQQQFIRPGEIDADREDRWQDFIGRWLAQVQQPRQAQQAQQQGQQGQQQPAIRFPQNVPIWHPDINRSIGLSQIGQALRAPQNLVNRLNQGLFEQSFNNQQASLRIRDINSRNFATKARAQAELEAIRERERTRRMLINTLQGLFGGAGGGGGGGQIPTALAGALGASGRRVNPTLVNNPVRVNMRPIQRNLAANLSVMQPLIERRLLPGIAQNNLAERGQRLNNINTLLSAIG
jgi:hypothetical protein